MNKSPPGPRVMSAGKFNDASSGGPPSPAHARSPHPATVWITPVGSTVAYGLHADALSAINATRAEISEGDYGLYNAGGLVCVRQGVIAAQRVSAGAVDLATPDAATTLSDVAFVHNARDTITRHSDLPTASSLPPPPPIQP